MGESKHCLHENVFKLFHDGGPGVQEWFLYDSDLRQENVTSFLMIFRLIDFTLVVLHLLMFKVCGIIGISKIEFFNFFSTERVKYQKFICIQWQTCLMFKSSEKLVLWSPHTTLVAFRVCCLYCYSVFKYGSSRLKDSN